MNDCYFSISSPVMFDKSLVANAKLLYGVINSLCSTKGYCWASNRYFAKLFDVDKATISRWISSLEKRGYIFFKGVDENVNGIDDIVNTPRQICIAPLDNLVKQNIKLNNKDNNIARTRSKSDTTLYGAYDIELFERMVNSKD